MLTHSPQHSVTLIAGRRGVLLNHDLAVRIRVMNQLDKQGIQVISQRATGQAGGLLLDDDHFLTADSMIAATGSLPAKWLRQSQMTLSVDGYASVNAHHRSVSHRNIFAYIEGKPLTSYYPRKKSLYLLLCSNQRAILSWKGRGFGE